MESLLLMLTLWGAVHLTLLAFYCITFIEKGSLPSFDCFVKYFPLFYNQSLISSLKHFHNISDVNKSVASLCSRQLYLKENYNVANIQQNDICVALYK